MQIHLNSRVTGVSDEGVAIGKEFIPSSTVLWAAGIGAEPVVSGLGIPTDNAGRVIVEPDLSVMEHPEAFIIGDAASFSHGTEEALPSLAPVALQQGRFAAAAIAAELRGDPRGTFSYLDKGTLSTIGRKAAVADLGRFRLTGFIAWVAWLLVHILYLIGFRNRAVVLFQWA